MISMPTRLPSLIRRPLSACRRAARAALLVAFVAAATAAAEEPESREDGAPAPARALAPAEALLRALREAGVEVDSAALSSAFEAAVLRGVDPNGRILDADGWARLQAERDGLAGDGGSTSGPPAVAHATSLPRRLAWMKLNVIRDDSADDIAEPIRKWAAEGRRGLILDLRGAVGNGREAVARVAEALAGRGFLFAIESANGKPVSSFEGRNGEGFGPPVILLIDRRTAGAAELLAAVLAGLRRGALAIGERTAGDCGMRSAVPLDGGRFAYVLVSRLRRSDGSPFDGREGLAPNIAVDLDSPEPPQSGEGDEDERSAFRRRRRQPLALEEEDRALREQVGDDRVLRRAVDLLLGLQALDLGKATDHPD